MKEPSDNMEEAKGEIKLCCAGRAGKEVVHFHLYMTVDEWKKIGGVTEAKVEVKVSSSLLDSWPKKKQEK